MAQAGGKDKTKIGEALQLVKILVAQQANNGASVGADVGTGDRFSFKRFRRYPGQSVNHY